MWFKNLQIYQFDDEFTLDPTEWEDALRQAIFRPCASIMPMSIGWHAPLGHSEEAPLVHLAQGFGLIRLEIEEKILPSTVVNEQLQQRVTELQESQQRKISSKEKMALKEDIYATLLPRAFTRHKKLHALIDIAHKRLIIDTSNRGKAEEFITFLRKTLGSLPVKLIETIDVGYALTQWLKTRQIPVNFHLVDTCVMQDAKVDGPIIRCSNQDLLSPNIAAFIKDGLQIKQLELQWKEHLTFNLHHDFSVTGIKFFDIIHDLVRDIHTESPEQEFDANFVIMTQTLVSFIDEVLSLFQKP